MKKIGFVLMLITATATVSFAQDKVEQYCEVVIDMKLLSSRCTATIVYGSNSLIISSSQPKIKKDFDSLTDALNYMGALGWKLVSRDRKDPGINNWTIIFKKDFVKTEDKPASTY